MGVGGVGVQPPARPPAASPMAVHRVPMLLCVRAWQGRDEEGAMQCNQWGGLGMEDRVHGRALFVVFHGAASRVAGVAHQTGRPRARRKE